MKTCRKCGAVHDAKQCLACKKVATAKWRAKNTDRFNAAQAAYRLANAEKIKDRNKTYYADSPARSKQRFEKWKAANPDRAKARHREYGAKNRELIVAKNKRWRAEHPDEVRIHNHNRRARLRDRGGRLSKGLVAKLFELQRGCCACCGKPLGDDYHLDHRMPITLGGHNEDWNMQLLKSQCNTEKYNKHPIDFMQSRGFLL